MIQGYEEKLDFLVIFSPTGAQERLIFIRSAVQLSWFKLVKSSESVRVGCGCDCEKDASQIIKYLGYVHDA